MFERKSQPLLPFAKFRTRVIRFLVAALVLTCVWLAVGVVGLHFLADLSWEDSFYNAATFVSDMGPVSPLTTTAGKIFASVYALTSGLIFIGVAGIAFAPIIHRFFHIFHLEADAEQ